MNNHMQIIRRRPDDDDDDDGASHSSEDDDYNRLGETLIRATKFFGTIVKKGRVSAEGGDPDGDLDLDDVNRHRASLGSAAAKANGEDENDRAGALALNERYDERNKGNLHSCVRSVRHTGGGMEDYRNGSCRSMRWPPDDEEISLGDSDEGSKGSMPTIEERLGSGDFGDDGNDGNDANDDSDDNSISISNSISNSGRSRPLTGRFQRQASIRRVTETTTDESGAGGGHRHHRRDSSGASSHQSSSSLLGRMDSVKHLFGNGARRRSSLLSNASEEDSNNNAGGTAKIGGNHGSGNNTTHFANGGKKRLGGAAAFGTSINMGVGAITELVSGGLTRNNSNGSLRQMENGGGDSFNSREMFNNSFDGGSSLGDSGHRKKCHASVSGGGPPPSISSTSSSTFTGHHAKSRSKFMKRNVEHAAGSSESFRNLQVMMKERGVITGNAVVHMLQEVAEEHAVQRNDGEGWMANDASMDLSHIMLDRDGNNISGDRDGSDSHNGRSSSQNGGGGMSLSNFNNSMAVLPGAMASMSNFNASIATLPTAPTSSDPQKREQLREAHEARQARLEQDPMFGGNGLIRPYITIPSREAKLEALVDVLRRAADQGRSCLLNVRGDKFVGKTRLLEEVIDKVQIQGLGYTVLTSRRSANDALTSFFSFREIVSRAVGACDAATERSDGSFVENDDDEDPEEGGDEAAVRRLVRRKILDKIDRLMIGRILPAVADDRLLSLLRGRSPAALTKDIAAALFKVLIPLQPVLLLFEADGDGCDIDRSSWDLMEELLSSAGERCPQMLLAATSRRPLGNVPASLGRERYVDVHVEPADRADTESYVRALFCDPRHVDRNMTVDDDVAACVHNRCGGCPLLTERMVLWGQRTETIELDETRNAVASNLPQEGVTLLDVLPANLNEEILEVINDLPHHLLDALKLAASLGITFDVNNYKTLRDDEGLHDSLREVMASHCIFEETDDRYKWKHVAVYEAVESIIISNERVEIHNRIADSLLRDGKGFQGGSHSHSHSHAHRYAGHYVMAERWDEAFDRYMEAGGRAEEKLDFVGAVGMYQQAKLCLRKSRRKPSLQRKLSPHAALGWCLRELVRYDDAEKELEYCLKQTMAVPERKRRNNSQFEEIELDVMTTLATLKQAQSKYGEAAEMFERALPLARANKEKHSRVWLAHHVASCAEIHRKSGDLERASALHTEALGYRELACGEEQSCTSLELALSFTQLGCTLSGLGDHSKAYGLHKKALSVRAEHLDFYHGLVSESLNYCADALQALRRGAEGIPLGMHAVKIRKFVFGPHHPAYAHALSVLASCYHSVGRSFDSLGLLKECLEICEKAFSKNHANMIPNLRLYGSVLSDTGNNDKAREVYERALSIHKMNFKEGKNKQQLVKLRNASKELSNADMTRATPRASIEMPIPSFELDDGARTHVIVCADVGHRASDEYMLSLASSLQRMGTIKLMGVIAVSPPQVVRADIARGALDSLLLSDVPVAYSGVVSTRGLSSRAGAGGGGGAVKTFNTDYGRPSAHVNNTGVELMIRSLLKAPPKSLVIMGNACLGDLSEVIDTHRDLFASKVKQVAMLGSVKHVRRRSLIVPEEESFGDGGERDRAFAKNVYRACQESEIPTVTLSKDLSRGFPFPSDRVDDLTSTNHMVATKVQRSEEMQTNGTWELIKKLRQEAPSRNGTSHRTPTGWDAKSFAKYVLGGKHPNASQHNIWPSIKSIDLELALGLLSCVPVYRDSHFRWETHKIRGVEHRICRQTNASAGIIKPEALSNEIHMLIGFAFRTSLQNTSC